MMNELPYFTWNLYILPLSFKYFKLADFKEEYINEFQGFVKDILEEVLLYSFYITWHLLPSLSSLDGMLKLDFLLEFTIDAF